MGELPERASTDDLQRLNFSWSVHSYINEYIRFADTKAGFFIAIYSSLVACMYSLNLHQLLNPSKINGSDFSIAITLKSLFAIIAFTGLISGIFVLSTVIFPRLWKKFYRTNLDWLRGKFSDVMETKKQAKGLLFWDEILLYASDTEYAKAVGMLDTKDCVKAVAKHNYALAGISSRKYRLLQLGFAVGLLGSVCSIVAIMLS